MSVQPSFRQQTPSAISKSRARLPQRPRNSHNVLQLVPWSPTEGRLPEALSRLPDNACALFPSPEVASKAGYGSACPEHLLRAGPGPDPGSAKLTGGSHVLAPAADPRPGKHFPRLLSPARPLCPYPSLNVFSERPSLITSSTRAFSLPVMCVIFLTPGTIRKFLIYVSMVWSPHHPPRHMLWEDTLSVLFNDRVHLARSRYSVNVCGVDA